MFTVFIDFLLSARWITPNYQQRFCIASITVEVRLFENGRKKAANLFRLTACVPLMGGGYLVFDSGRWATAL